MKGKKLKLFASVILAGALALTLTSCTLFGSSSGKTPYEIATETGYVGSEASYLAGLTGTDGDLLRTAYAEAREEGYTGTFLDFLKEYFTVAADDTAAVNRAAMSAVSIYCQFEIPSSGYRPIFGGTSISTSAGSGVIYSLDKQNGDAYVITNYHVVYDADSTGTETVPHISDEISLYLYGGEIASSEIKATYYGGAMDYDIAVLKVTGSDVLKNSSAKVVVGANSDAVSVGERVYAIGNPEGDGISVSGGVVSVACESINISTADESRTVSMWGIRTDATVNHGNSGGGLFNAEGKLVGIVNARSEEEGVYGVGYAIPSNLALSIAQNIIDNRTSTFCGAAKAMLGVTVQTVGSKSVFDENSQRAYIEETVVVQKVETGSIASGSIKAGDTVYSIALDGHETVVLNQQMILHLLFRVRKGDTVTVKVYRSGELLSYDLVFDQNSYFNVYS